MGISTDRQKWNQRWQKPISDSFLPEPHPLAQAWGDRFLGGIMLDAACGLGRGVASGGGAFHTIYAVDISDVAVRKARKFWKENPRIKWIVGDVTRFPWPDDFFGLICAFGFTDLSFFSRIPQLIKPGGMFLYEGFSKRQRTIKPDLNPDWTATRADLMSIFGDWEILACGETQEPSFRIHLATLRPEIID